MSARNDPQTFYLKRHDLRPAITVRLWNDDGSNPDLTGASVKFLMRNRTTLAVKINAPASIIDMTKGIVQYVWAGLDTDTAAEYDCEWEVTLSGGALQTYPNDRCDRVVITADIA